MDTISLPYNFVELDDRVIAAEPLPNRRGFNIDRKSGKISCKLTTLSPLYIAGKKGEFFHLGDPQDPVIPGSSLRGMIRNIVQVITWSKLQPVTKKKMYLRDLVNRPDYMDWFQDRVFAGFVHKDSSGYSLEACEHFRVHHSKLNQWITDFDQKKRKLAKDWFNNKSNLKEYEKESLKKWLANTGNLIPALSEKLDAAILKEYFFEKGGYPKWDFQNKPVWIKVGNKNDATEIKRSKPSDGEGWIEGLLVLTGWMDNKAHEFVFVRKTEPLLYMGEEVEDIIRELEGDDQLTDWQKTAFEKVPPGSEPRRKKGALRNEEPVFYIKGMGEDKDKIKFLGRARLFRLPYGRSPFEILPDSHRDSTHIDMTEAIFGFVEKDQSGTPPRSFACKGRVSFSDGKYKPGEGSPLWLKNEAFAPRILASPKPASYMTYLEQPAAIKDTTTEYASVSQFKKYSSGDARLRGQKFYWHQVKAENELAKPLEFNEIQQPSNNRNFEQRIKPVNTNISFTFTVHFEDLSEVELGALLWALTLPGTEHISSAHKLGMGKSIGMGSVKIIVESLDIIDLKERYASLESTGLKPESQQDFINKFIEKMDQELKTNFTAQGRIKHLRMILCQPGVDWQKVKYDDDQGFKRYQKQRDSLSKPVLKGVEDVYKDAYVNIKKTDQVQPQPVMAAEQVVGHLVRGVVEYMNPSDGITFKVDNSENLGVIEPKNFAGRGNNYQVGNRIKAMCISIEKEDDAVIYYCTLDFPKDLK